MIHAAVALSVAGFAYLLFDFLRATRAGAPIHDLPKRGAAFALLLAIAASCASIAAFNDATRASINVPIPGAETDETLTYFGPGTDWAIFPFDDSYITLGAARKRIEPFADGSASYAGVTSPGHIELLNDFVNGTRSPALFRNRVNGPIPEFLRGSSGDSLVFQMLSAMAAHAFGDSVRVLLVPLVYLVLAVMGCPRAGAFSAVAVGASGAFTFHALSGMETAAFVCVVAVTWAFAATALVRPYHSNVRLFLAVQVFVYLLFVDWNFYSLVRRPNPLHATLCLLLAIGGTIVAACRLTGPRGRVGRWKRVFIAFTFFLAAATVMNFRLLLGSEFDLPFDSIWIGEIVEFLISGGLIAIGWAIAPKLPSARPFLGRILTLAAAAVLAKWAFEFRPDALFLLAAIGVAGVWAWRVNGDRQPLGIAVAILVVTAVFALPGINYRWGVFEGILPPTGEAKSAFFNLGERGPGPAVAATLIGFGKLLARHIAFVPLMILGVRSAIGRKRGDLSERQMQSGVTAVIGLAFVVIFYAAYGAKFAAGLNMYWLRYHMPVQFVLLVFAGAGFAALAARAPAASDGTKAARRHRVAAIALVALCMGNVAWEAPRSLANFERDLQQTRRAVLPAAAWVAKNVPKGECVAAHDIGALTFFTDAKILDLVGLTDARVVAAHKANDEAALWRLIEQDRCTHLVIFEAWDEMFFHFRENHGDRLRLAWRSPPGRTPLHRYSIWRVMTE